MGKTLGVQVISRPGHWRGSVAMKTTSQSCSLSQRSMKPCRTGAGGESALRAERSSSRQKREHQAYAHEDRPHDRQEPAELCAPAPARWNPASVLGIPVNQVWSPQVQHAPRKNERTTDERAETIK